jgi:hypothetical protein
MKQVKIIIGNEVGSVPRDVIREAVRYVMDKTNYKPTTVKPRKRRSTSPKAK